MKIFWRNEETIFGVEDFFSKNIRNEDFFTKILGGEDLFSKNIRDEGFFRKILGMKTFLRKY